jgi:uncharacterized membrane protein YkvA (DUF1232 family)
MRVLLISLAVFVGAWLAVVLGLAVAGRRSAAREIATFLPNLILLFRGLLRDPRVPARSKLLLGVGLVWLSSPIDLIPEFIPVAGPLDDAVVAALILRHILKRAGPGPVRDHWRGGEGSLKLLLRVAGMADAPKVSD